MPPKINPLKLNALQGKTLVLFQELARHSETADTLESGEKVLTTLPKPHGNHFHVGAKVVMSKDATGLGNEAVWTALERKGLIRGTSFPFALTVTHAGLDYDSGMANILHGSDH